jgi:hypothetical protein
VRGGTRFFLSLEEKANMKPLWEELRTQDVFATTITVCGGGSAKPFLREPELLPPGIIIALDVPSELATLPTRQVPGREVYPLPIGAGETLATLAATADQAMQHALLNRPGTNLALGLAQLGGLGRELAIRLTNAAAFQLFVQTVFLPALYRLCRGMPETIQNLSIAGGGGGTGSQAALIVADALDLTVGAYTDATRELRHISLGPMNVLDHLGGHVIKNAASANLVNVAFAHRQPRDPKSYRTYAVIDDAPNGGLARQRECWICEVGQTLFASQVTELLRRLQPNQSAVSEFGNNALFALSRYPGIAAGRVAADVAAAIEPVVQQILRAAVDLTVLKSLAAHASRRPASVPSAASLAELAAVISDETLQVAIEAASLFAPTRVIAVTADDERYDVTEPQLTFASSPQTPVEMGQRLGMLRTVAFQNAQVAAEQELARQEAEYLLANRRRATQQWQAALQRRGWRRWSAPAQALARLVAAIEDQRKAFLLLEELEEVCRAHHRLAQQLDSEIAAIEARLTRLAARLDGAARQALAAAEATLVVPVSSNTCFAALLAASDLDDEAEFLDTLRRSVQFVTLAGLQRIVGAPSTRPEELLQAIYRGEGVIVGPHWGGKRRQDKALRLLVLPPLREQDAAVLREQHERLNGRAAHLLFADLATLSVNIVLLEMHTCQQPKEMFPKLLRKGLLDALASEHPVLFLDRPELVQELGGRITEHDIVFDEAPVAKGNGSVRRELDTLNGE